MFKRTIALGLALAFVGGTLAPSAAGEERSAAALAEANLKAARQTLNALMEAYRTGNGPVDVEKVYLWSRRVLEAQRDISSKKADQLAAIEEHLARMKGWRENAAKRYKAGQGTHAEVSAMEFFVTQAELWLAQANAK